MSNITAAQSRSARKLLCLTQKQTAQNSGIPETTVYKIEKGRIVADEMTDQLYRFFVSQNVIFLYDERNFPTGVYLGNPDVPTPILWPQYTPVQIPLARSWLGWSAVDLANQSGVCESTIRDFEKARYVADPDTKNRVYRAFHRAGIRFLRDEELCNATAERYRLWGLGVVQRAALSQAA